MPTFILLTKLSPESLGRLKDRKQVGSRWLEAVKASCPQVRWINYPAASSPPSHLLNPGRIRRIIQHNVTLSPVLSPLAGGSKDRRSVTGITL